MIELLEVRYTVVLLLVAAGFGIAACGGTKKECKAATDHAFELVSAGRADVEESEQRAFKSAMDARCGVWPDATRECVATAGELLDLHRCLADSPVERPSEDQCDAYVDQVLSSGLLEPDGRARLEEGREQAVEDCLESGRREEITCSLKAADLEAQMFCRSDFIFREIRQECLDTLSAIRMEVKVALADDRGLTDGPPTPAGLSAELREWGNPAGGWEVLGWKPESGKVRGSYELRVGDPPPNPREQHPFELRCEIDADGDGTPAVYVAAHNGLPTTETHFSVY